MPIRVAIVEDDDEIRASLSELIGANSTFRCVRSYPDAESALAARGAAAAAPRETDVLNQLAQGFRYKEIVDNLGISAGTLHSYISNVYEKLHVHSRTEAVVKYLNH